MNIMFPITFTIQGIGWRNSPIMVTLYYENGQTLKTSTISKDMLTGAFSIEPVPVSGYFLNNNSDKVRITNLVGYDGNTFLKYCPKCEEIKPIVEFDYSGRYTGETRDQSNCMSCRGLY